jgi:tRNA-specific 2-thiouridylase
MWLISLKNKMNNRTKVVVAMSGGVDSSVAAVLLVNQGYDVSGAFMKNWSIDMEGVDYKPWENEANDAKLVCETLNIPFEIYDFEKEYRQKVVDEFIDQYALGVTPNPDVLCNKEIKFNLFLNRAMSSGAEYIATGHYARLMRHGDKFALAAGIDANKDQSYFLYTLDQFQMSHTLFPLGDLTKSEVRIIAERANLSNCNKKDSQGVCFIGPVSMRKFLQQFLDIKPGDVVTTNGDIVGKHDGVIYYTEGQRHGFGSGGAHAPLYIAEKNVVTNQLTVANSGDSILLTDRIVISECTWSNQNPKSRKKYGVRVRYRQPLVNAKLAELESKNWGVQFEIPILGVSIGQSVVVYDGKEVVGGGIITSRIA